MSASVPPAPIPFAHIAGITEKTITAINTRVRSAAIWIGAFSIERNMTSLNVNSISENNASEATYTGKRSK